MDHTLPQTKCLLTEPVVLILQQMSNNNSWLLSYVCRNKNTYGLQCCFYGIQHENCFKIHILCKSKRLKSSVIIPLGESWAEICPFLHHYFSPFTKGRSNHRIFKLSRIQRINNGISGQMKKIELTKLPSSFIQCLLAEKS